LNQGGSQARVLKSCPLTGPGTERGTNVQKVIKLDEPIFGFSGKNFRVQFLNI